MTDPNPEKFGLPPRVFLYTVDQISVVLNIPQRDLHSRYLYHEGRDVGIQHKDHIVCHDISRPDQLAEWRVSERELIRWLKFKGFKYYDRGTITR